MHKLVWINFWKTRK